MTAKLMHRLCIDICLRFWAVSSMRERDRVLYSLEEGERGRVLASLKGRGGSGLQKFEVRLSRGLKFSSGEVTFLISAIHLSK